MIALDIMYYSDLKRISKSLSSLTMALEKRGLVSCPFDEIDDDPSTGHGKLNPLVRP